MIDFSKFESPNSLQLDNDILFATISVVLLKHKVSQVMAHELLFVLEDFFYSTHRHRRRRSNSSLFSAMPHRSSEVLN